MNINEFKIPVPWGHVAVKAWGNEENTPVLAIHGLGDNAGTFDRLMPFLPTSFYYICIDLPSHGKSSHYPPHLFITALDNILTLKLIVDYLNRKKYIFMGHSWGAQTEILFTQLYPEYVFKLIIFDAFYLSPVAVKDFKNFLIDRFENLLKINDNLVKNKQPWYTYEEAVTKLIDGRVFGKLTRESAEAIAKRSLVPTEGGKFKFSMDPRLKTFVNPLFDMKYVVQLVKEYDITCPMLFIYGSESYRFDQFKSVVKEFQRNRNFIIKKVVGNHDVHTNKPEIVGPIVNQFLMNIKSKL